MYLLVELFRGLRNRGEFRLIWVVVLNGGLKSCLSTSEQLIKRSETTRHYWMETRLPVELIVFTVELKYISVESVFDHRNARQQLRMFLTD